MLEQLDTWKYLRYVISVIYMSIRKCIDSIMHCVCTEKNTILKQYLYVYHMWKRVVLSRANNSRTTYANNNSNAVRIKVLVVHC